jgi:hypothetical protein
MMEGQYCDLLQYHFWTPDYENGVRDLVSSYIIPIFYTDDYDETLMKRFSLVIFTDAGELGNGYSTILESVAKTCDILVFRPDMWIDITSATSAMVLGVSFSSHSARGYDFETADTMVFSQGFLGSFTPDYNQPIRFYDPNNIVFDNTCPVLRNKEKQVTVITEYTNDYCKHVYTCLGSEKVYSSWDRGVGILKRGCPTLSTCMAQFYKQLYAKYEGKENEFCLAKDNWGYLVFPYENPKTDRELNFTFSWVCSHPFLKAVSGGKSSVYFEYSYSAQTLTVTLRSSCATNVSIVVDCAGKGSPKSVSIDDWTYDDYSGMLTIDCKLCGAVDLQAVWPKPATQG